MTDTLDRTDANAGAVRSAGFFSDVFALVLLVPAVRASIYNAFATRFRTSFDATFARAAPRRPNGGPRSATLVIEGEIGVDGPRRG